jgi:replicative DNA helicase
MTMTLPSALTDFEPEIAVLGSALIDVKSCIERIGPALRPEHFVVPANQLIYAVMLDLWERGKPTDIIGVCHELKRRGQLDEVGTEAYVASLWRIWANALDAPYYAELVVQMAQGRRVDDAKAALERVAIDDAQFPVLVEELRDALAEATEPFAFTSLADGLTRMNEDLDRKMAGIEVGCKTGFRDLDAKMGAWEDGDLVVLAALTSAGKTSWALNVAYYLTTHGKRVAFFSMEMNQQQIAVRLTSLASGIPASQIRNATLTPSEMERYADVQGPLAALLLRLDAKRIPSVREMRLQLQAEHRHRPFSLVVVDLLGTVRGEGNDFGRTQEVSQIATDLKALARDLEVPILACQQLNRQANARHEPELSDIKDSSTVEQVASVVLLLTPAPRAPAPGESTSAKVNIAKNRNGETGPVELHFDWKTMRFGDIDYRYGSTT